MLVLIRKKLWSFILKGHQKLYFILVLLNKQAYSENDECLQRRVIKTPLSSL